jgi:hypothetical protein
MSTKHQTAPDTGGTTRPPEQKPSQPETKYSPRPRQADAEEAEIAGKTLATFLKGVGYSPDK